MRALSLFSAAMICGASPAYAAPIINLGSAATFGVLAGSTVTNTGPSVVNGNVGVSPGTAITGFPPGTSSGAIYSGGAAATQAAIDLATAYTAAAGLTGGTNLSGQNLGGLVLLPGVYTFNSPAGLTGALTLNGLNNPNSVFVFQIGSTLTSASGSSVLFSNGGNAANVFWQVGSSATLGTNSAFAGSILALTSITLNTGASLLNGRALAQNGAVTLDTNLITVPGPVATAAPESATWMLMIIGFGAIGLRLRVRNRAQGLSPA